MLDHMYMSLFSTCGWILRLIVTVALLMSIHPALALLAVFALPTVLVSAWRPGVERAAEEQGAPFNRLARHLFVTATTAPPGKEVRVTGIGDRLVTERRAAWERWYVPVAAARWGSAFWHMLAWAFFGLGFVAAVLFATLVIHATPGNVLLVLAAGSRLSAYIVATVGEIGFLRGIWPTAQSDWPGRGLCSRPDRARERACSAATLSRDSLRERLLHLSRHRAARARGRMPGSSGGLRRGHRRRELGRQDHPGQAFVPALPTHKRADTRRRARAWADAIDAWRSRLTGEFQDFFRFEFRAQHVVGVGDVSRLDDQAAVAAAIGTRRGGRCDRQVGGRARDGSSARPGPAAWRLALVSGRNWRLARGFMRDSRCSWCWRSQPPALDAETEHALFERYAAASRNGKSNGKADKNQGRITILVSHRFSTVRMADSSSCSTVAT